VPGGEENRRSTTSPLPDYQKGHPPEMNTQTSQAPQYTHHYVLTLQCQNRNGGIKVGTFHAQITPPDGWTRAQLYTALVDQLIHDKDMPGAQTLFFALEPNQL
jgi:hypothetical protein